MTRTDSAILAPPIGLVAFLALQLACAAATGDGCAVKIFKAYRLDGDAYVFAGQFTAPARTANKDLHTFVRCGSE